MPQTICLLLYVDFKFYVEENGKPTPFSLLLGEVIYLFVFLSGRKRNQG